MDIEYIQENLPFLACIEYGKETFVGIVQNADDKIITIYDLGIVKSEADRKKLIALGDIWWSESNRMLPISVFLVEQMKEFRYCLKTLSAKEAVVIFGPVVSLSNLVKKRIKRKQIQLVRKM